MQIKRLLAPAVSIMDKLPFKIKIVSTISILFILLILPSYNILFDYIKTNKQLNKQIIGMYYSQNLQEIIQQIQLHRGLRNTTKTNTKINRNKILKIEQTIKQKLQKLIAYDQAHLNILQNNQKFIDALGKLELISLKNSRKDLPKEDLFTLHSKIIASLIATIQESAKRTSFYTSNILNINTIAFMLAEKLLYLQEYTAQIRGLGAGIFKEKKITQQDKKEILTRYTLLNRFQVYLDKEHIPSQIPDYLKIQKQSQLAAYKLDEILDIVNRYILFSSKETPSYDAKKFFSHASLALLEQNKLYQMLLKSYNELIDHLKSKNQLTFVMLLLGLLAILLGTTYLFSVFYYSVSQSLKQLEIASEKITKGEMNIQLESNTRDEIGDALLAFNIMSQRLRTNISFLNSYKKAIDESSIVSKTNTKGVITYVNKKFCEISGYSEEELLGKPHNIIRHPDTPKETFAKMWKVIKSGQVWHGIVRNRAKNGETYIVDATIIPLIDNNKKIIEYVAVRHDITELERSKEEIQKQKTDLLTNLPNRNQIQEDLLNTQKPVLFYLNIDNFTNLNDFYGTKVGDQVLINFALLLKNITQETQTKVYRLQGDEFVILFEEGEFSEYNYHIVCEKIIEYIEAQNIDCDTQSDISITLSGGIAFFNDKEPNRHDLITYASLARKVAKSENKKFLRYDKKMTKEQDYVNNILWIKKIKEAISEDRIVPYFQPIIDNQTGKITKYESLVRLIDKNGKAISPFFFLEIAQKAKLYSKITKIVLDKAFKAFANTPYDFSINLAIEDLKNEEIVSYIYHKLQHCTNHAHVIFEIIESEEITDYNIVNQFIKNVKQYGAKIAIDDFGSGYANFEHILEIDADFIKIDGSLIKKIDTDTKSRIITEAIIAFSKRLGRKTVVEYVHNQKIYEEVKLMGADYSQGFYLGEPSPYILHKEQMPEYADLS